MPPEGIQQQGSFAGGPPAPAQPPAPPGSMAGGGMQPMQQQGGDIEAQIKQMVASMPEEKLMEIIMNMHDQNYLMNLVQQMSGGNQEDMEYAVDALELLLEAVGDFAMEKYNKTLGMMNPQLKEKAAQSAQQSQGQGVPPTQQPQQQPPQGSFVGGGGGM